MCILCVLRRNVPKPNMEEVSLSWDLHCKIVFADTEESFLKLKLHSQCLTSLVTLCNKLYISDYG